MVVVGLVTMVAALAVLLKALVWARAVAEVLGEVLVIAVLSDVLIAELGVVTNVLTGEMLGVGAKMVVDDLEVIVVPELAIALEFRVPVTQSVDALFGTVVGVFTDALPAVITGIVSCISVGVLPGVKENAFEAAMTALDFAVSAPLRAFSC